MALWRRGNVMVNDTSCTRDRQSKQCNFGCTFCSLCTCSQKQEILEARAGLGTGSSAAQLWICQYWHTKTCAASEVRVRVVNMLESQPGDMLGGSSVPRYTLPVMKVNMDVMLLQQLTAFVVGQPKSGTLIAG